LNDTFNRLPSSIENEFIQFGSLYVVIKFSIQFGPLHVNK